MDRWVEPLSGQVFRYRKGSRTRTYRLAEAPDARLELWVAPAGSPKGRPRKLATLDRDRDVEPFLESIRQELRAGGWSEF